MEDYHPLLSEYKSEIRLQTVESNTRCTHRGVVGVSRLENIARVYIYIYVYVYIDSKGARFEIVQKSLNLAKALTQLDGLQRD